MTKSLLRLKHDEIAKIEARNELDKGTKYDIYVLLKYIDTLETMIEDYSDFGTEGWEHAIEDYIRDSSRRG